jgi:S1-C subfamily serine protease
MSPSATPGVLQTLSDELAGAVERAGRSVVAIHARRRIPSSGIHWRPGVVVAASHTIRRDDDIAVTLAGGERASAELAGRDASTDLAVLRLDARDVAPARLAPPELTIGQLVLALGRPGRDVTASLGIISALGDEWRTMTGGRIDRFVRLDIAVYDGFSGGPLVDAAGRVLGVNTSGLGRASALTIPVSTVERVASQILERGSVRRGYLGLALQPVRLHESLARSLGLASPAGLMVIGIEEKGPADAAGLLPGDVLVAVDGEPVSDPSELLGLLGPERVGQRVSARVVRAGKSQTVTIDVGERPSGRGR